MVTAPLLVLFVIAVMHFSKCALANLDPNTNIFVAIGVIQLATIAFPCILYYLLKGRKLAEPMYLVSRSGPNLVFLLFAAMVFISGSLLIKFFYFTNSGNMTAPVNFYQDFSGTTEGTSQMEIILSFIIIPAFCEEFFFRGVILSEYRRFGSFNAVVMSSVCFAMLHFSIENLWIYLFIGFLFGFVAATTRSIIPSLALHLLSNTLNIYGSDAFLRITVVKNGEYFIGFLLTLLTGVSLVLLLFRTETILRYYTAKPPTESIPPKSTSHMAKVFFSPSFLLLLIAFACFTTLNK